MEKVRILIDNGHGSNTPGKCSPDKRLREYAWSREFAQRLRDALRREGMLADLVTPETWDVSLHERVGRVNKIAGSAGAGRCVLLSVHNNASGSDGKWHSACGWSVFVSKNSSVYSRRLARMLTDEALRRGLTGNRSVPASRYWTWSWTKSDIFLLKHTACPAILTENMFMDNEKDVDFLLSEAGMSELVGLHLNGLTQYIDSL